MLAADRAQELRGIGSGRVHLLGEFLAERRFVRLRLGNDRRESCCSWIAGLVAIVQRTAARNSSCCQPDRGAVASNRLASDRLETRRP